MNPAVAIGGNTWDGGGTTDNWNDVANWNPDGLPAYGTVTFAGSTRTSVILNTDYNLNQINWTGASNWSLTNTGSFSISLFDNSGTQAKLENNSAGLVTIDTPIRFAANNASPPSPFGEINAVSGDMTFGTGTLTVNGSSVNGIKLFGGNHVITFNNTVSAAGKWFGITTGGTGNTINIGGSFTSSDFYVMNDGTLNLNSGGSLTTSVRLGGDFGNTGNQNQTKSGTFNLSAASGGQTFSGVVNSVSGNTSGTLAVNSQNTSGTNTLSGHIALDSALKIIQSAGGTLNITQLKGGDNTTGNDIKGNTETFTPGTGATINHSGTIYNSAGSGALVLNGSGNLILSGNNSYAGGTTIKSGALLVAVSDTSTTVGALGGSSRSVLLGDTSGSNNASLLTSGAFTVGNSITAQSGTTGNVLLIGGDTASSSIFTGNVFLGTASADTKPVTFVAASGGAVAFSGIINENTSPANGQSGAVTIGDASHTGTVKFSNIANGYGGSTTIVNGATLEVVKLTAGGSNSSIGNSGSNAAAGSAASNVFINGGTLKYTGTGDTTNRLFTFDANGATVDASASANAALSFTGTGALVASGTGNRTLTLTGSSTGGNSLASVIPNPSSGVTSLKKSGEGSWKLSAANTFTGATSIENGTLEAAAANALGGTSNVTINSGGTLLLSGSGNRINDGAGLTFNAGTFNTGGTAGEGNASTVGIGVLTLSASSNLDFGTSGVASLMFTGGSFTAGTLTILNWTGSMFTAGTDGVTDRLMFEGDDAERLGFLAAFSQSSISFSGFASGYTAVQFDTNHFELVPVPEPGAIFTAFGLLGLIGYRERRCRRNERRSSSRF
jgi:fibronectin-binding autotransporter adhesin